MELSIKRINTQGIVYIEPLDGSTEWYWGSDYTSGDLYEAEELFKHGHPVNQNKLLFFRYPDGKTVQPVVAKKGQYFGKPIYYNGRIIILAVDFPSETIKLIEFDDANNRTSLLANIPLSSVEDCYNLMLKESPLMLTRQGSERTFQIVWPEKKSFEAGNTESFLARRGEKLYFSAWYEDPDYREEVIIRNMETGEIVDRIPGGLTVMPNGQIWILA